MRYEQSIVYRPSSTFAPLFEHPAQRVLTALSQGFGEGIGLPNKSLVRCEVPALLSQPKMSVLAPITTAINLGKAIHLGYTSVESGRSEREIVPLALAACRTNAVQMG